MKVLLSYQKPKNITWDNKEISLGKDLKDYSGTRINVAIERCSHPLT